MVLFNEQVVYTAHLQKTATETFEELCSFFEEPALKKYVAEIKTALGREQIVLKNGARIKFLARTRNGGRGQHGDLLIIDEAQEIDENQQASFLPAISASINPQTIYVGTPPDPSAVGTVFRGIRAKALAGESEKTAWFEFSVDEIGDVKDASRWAATNPALGRRILYSTIESESEQMDPDTFARERLGWWAKIVETKEDLAIDPAAWEACASDEMRPEGKIAYGIKFRADGSEVCLCGAVCPPEGPARISLIKRAPTVIGVQWLADWLNERTKVACCVVIEKGGKLHTFAQFFMPENKIDELQEREGVPYRLYVSMGLIKPSGENYVDYNDCFDWFRMLVEEYEILPLQVGYDRYSAQYLVQQMEQYGFHMDDVYQGENLTPVIHECDGLLRDQTLQLGKNNLLKAHFLNVGMKQNEETRKIRPVKIDQRCHIDGFVAVIDALTVRQKWYDQIGEQLRNEE